MIYYYGYASAVWRHYYAMMLLPPERIYAMLMIARNMPRYSHAAIDEYAARRARYALLLRHDVTALCLIFTLISWRYFAARHFAITPPPPPLPIFRRCRR